MKSNNYSFPLFGCRHTQTRKIYTTNQKLNLCIQQQYFDLVECFFGEDVLMQSRNHCSFRETGEKKNHGIKLDASFEQSKLIAKEVHRPASYGIYIHFFLSLLFRFTAIISSILFCVVSFSISKILTFNVKITN